MIKGDRIALLRVDPNKFYITKHLLLQDYTTLRGAITDLRLDDKIDPKESLIPCNAIRTLIKPKNNLPTPQESFRNNLATPQESIKNDSSNQQQENSKISHQSKGSSENNQENSKEKINEKKIVEYAKKKPWDESDEFLDSEENLEILQQFQKDKKFQNNLQKSQVFDKNPNKNTLEPKIEKKPPLDPSNQLIGQQIKLQIPPLKTQFTISQPQSIIIQNKPTPFKLGQNVDLSDRIIESTQEDAEKSHLQSKIEESLTRLKSQEQNYEKEKFALMNKINFLEEKNYLLASSLSRKNLDVYEEDLSRSKNLMTSQKKFETSYSDLGFSPKAFDFGTKNKEEYYVLCDEIEKVYKEIQEAELAYVMHRRTHFPKEFS